MVGTLAERNAEPSRRNVHRKTAEGLCKYRKPSVTQNAHTCSKIDVISIGKCFPSRLQGLGAGLLGSHLRVDGLNILPLGNGTLVASQTSLGKLVNSLVSGTSTSLDHIKNPPLVRGESGNLTGNFTAEGGALAKFL